MPTWWPASIRLPDPMRGAPEPASARWVAGGATRGGDLLPDGEPCPGAAGTPAAAAVAAAVRRARRARPPAPSSATSCRAAAWAGLRGQAADEAPHAPDLLVAVFRPDTPEETSNAFAQSLNLTIERRYELSGLRLRVFLLRIPAAAMSMRSCARPRATSGRSGCSPISTMRASAIPRRQAIRAATRSARIPCPRRRAARASPWR